MHLSRAPVQRPVARVVGRDEAGAEQQCDRREPRREPQPPHADDPPLRGDPLRAEQRVDDRRLQPEPALAAPVEHGVRAVDRHQLGVVRRGQALDHARVAARRQQQRERPRTLGAEAVAVDLDRAARLDDAGYLAAVGEHAPGRAPCRVPGVDPALATRRRCGVPVVARATRRQRAAVRPRRRLLRAREPLLPVRAHDRPRPQAVERTRDERGRAHDRGAGFGSGAGSAAGSGAATAFTVSATTRRDGPSRCTASSSRAAGAEATPTIFPGFRLRPGSKPSNSARSIATPGSEMSCSSHAACSVPTAWWCESVAPESTNACWIAALTAPYSSSGSRVPDGVIANVKYMHAPEWYECDRWHMT